MTYGDVLRAAAGHAKAMQRAIRRALDTLDDEPVQMEPDHIDPVPEDPALDNPETRRSRMRLVKRLS